ncbi:MAG: winged helix-turn-helix transcriptional regulator, partial [Planctomycetia bacterium]|nr:winged helix-turn-helix transcriptional regulator [Planctomycetia bacterium]
ATNGPSDVRVAELADLFKILSDENRLRIVLRVCYEGEQNVTDLCQLVQLPQPLVSHHLGRLREAGVLRTRRDGKHIYYSLQRERFEQLMSMLAGRREHRPPCDCFLECMIG